MHQAGVGGARAKQKRMHGAGNEQGRQVDGPRRCPGGRLEDPVRRLQHLQPGGSARQRESAQGGI